jgi:preprotein translocase subunit SecG
MWNVLLFIHIIVALLLIAVILLQKTSTDGLSGIGGGSNMGLVSARSATNFMTKTTIVLGILFFINSLVLANLSSRKSEIYNKIEHSTEQIKEDSSLPVAK